MITLALPAIAVVIHAVTDRLGNSYDPVATMFVCVWILSVGPVFVVGSQLRKLNSKLRLLKKPDAADSERT